MTKIFTALFYRLLCVIVLSLLLISCGQRKDILKNEILVITDIGTDIDDAEALCLAASDSTLRIAALACIGENVDERIDIAKYLLESFESRGVVGSGVAFIDSVLSNSKRKMDILLIAPMTDIAAAVERNPKLINKIGEVFFQGQVVVNDDAEILANAEAFNVSEDIHAANTFFKAAQSIPFTVVGKYAVYPLALSREVFDNYEASGHPAGIYLKKAAYKSIRNFAYNKSDVFRRVYSIPSDIAIEEALKGLDKISNPYDAVSVISLTHPEFFNPIKVGQHRIIGNQKGVSNIINLDGCKIELENIF